MTHPKSFEQLSKRGKAQRLRRVAIEALRNYDLDVIDLPLLGMFTNTLFRIRTSNGETYVIRLCAPGWRTELDIRSEITWLQALTNFTEIGAPRPIPTREGEYLISVKIPDKSVPILCLMMTWIPGMQLEKHLTEKNLEKMGILFARLHEFSAGYVPPSGFTQRQMNKVLARDEENLLFSPATMGQIGEHERDILDQVNQQVEAAYQDLYARSGLRVIHHDLWHGNIKIDRGRLRPLDFEDTVWGYPIQDIAMAMQDLMNDVPVESYEPLLAAFQKGYEQMHSWPEVYDGQMDTFRVGRMLWVANWVARYQNQYIVDHINWLVKMFEEYLATGKLRKKTS